MTTFAMLDDDDNRLAVKSAFRIVLHGLKV